MKRRLLERNVLKYPIKITEPCYSKDEICPLLESAGTGKYSMVEHVHSGKMARRYMLKSQPRR